MQSTDATAATAAAFAAAFAAATSTAVGDDRRPKTMPSDGKLSTHLKGRGNPARTTASNEEADHSHGKRRSKAATRQHFGSFDAARLGVFVASNKRSKSCVKYSSPELILQRPVCRRDVILKNDVTSAGTYVYKFL